MVKLTVPEQRWDGPCFFSFPSEVDKYDKYQAVTQRQWGSKRRDGNLLRAGRMVKAPGPAVSEEQTH